jgi:hypothetical protein
MTELAGFLALGGRESFPLRLFRFLLMAYDKRRMISHSRPGFNGRLNEGVKGLTFVPVEGTLTDLVAAHHDRQSRFASPF